MAGPASATGCDVQLRDGWVRAAPPGAMMLAGYGRLVNDGDAAVRIDAARSAQFAAASMHETVEEAGLSKMRALDTLTVPAHGAVDFAPGGKHFMLMRPAVELAVGATVELSLHADCGEIAAKLPLRETQ